MIEVSKEQIEALHREAFELENKADCLRQNLIDFQWKINALIYPEKEFEPKLNKNENLSEEAEFTINELDFNQWPTEE